MLARWCPGGVQAELISLAGGANFSSLVTLVTSGGTWTLAKAALRGGGGGEGFGSLMRVVWPRLAAGPLEGPAGGTGRPVRTQRPPLHAHTGEDTHGTPRGPGTGAHSADCSLLFFSVEPCGQNIKADENERAEKPCRGSEHGRGLQIIKEKPRPGNAGQCFVGLEVGWLCLALPWCRVPHPLSLQAPATQPLRSVPRVPRRD